MTGPIIPSSGVGGEVPRSAVSHPAYPPGVVSEQDQDAPVASSQTWSLRRQSRGCVVADDAGRFGWRPSGFSKVLRSPVCEALSTTITLKLVHWSPIEAFEAQAVHCEVVGESLPRGDRRLREEVPDRGRQRLGAPLPRVFAAEGLPPLPFFRDCFQRAPRKSPVSKSSAVEARLAPAAPSESRLRESGRRDERLSGGEGSRRPSRDWWLWSAARSEREDGNVHLREPRRNLGVWLLAG